MSKIHKKRSAEQLLRPDIAFVIKLAVASLGKFYAKPFGPAKQVKQMLGRPCGRRVIIINILVSSVVSSKKI